MVRKFSRRGSARERIDLKKQEPALSIEKKKDFSLDSDTARASPPFFLVALHHQNDLARRSNVSIG
jgi:hypothetical protein